MPNVGFKGFAKPATIASDMASGMVSNISSDEYVLFTGGSYGRRRASGRSACLLMVTEKMKPIALRTYVDRCLKAAGSGKGYDTSISVGGLSLHQGAKPAVYLYLVKDAEGNFRSKKSIPNPDPAHYAKPFSAGDIVIPATATRAVTTRRAVKQIAKK